MAKQENLGDATTTRVRSNLTGYVVSAAMDQTIVVQIDRRTKHGLYKKYVRRSTRIKAHDADNVCGVGDFVEIREGRPTARHKSWTLERVLESADNLQSTG